MYRMILIMSEKTDNVKDDYKTCSGAAYDEPQ